MYQEFRCGRRTQKCRACKYEYSKADYDLWECPQCGEDRHCGQLVKEAGKACRRHGGESLKGLASPQFKHGGYSKYLPGRYRKRYEEAMGDPDLLELLPDIALIRAKINTLIDQLEEEGQPDDPVGRLMQARSAFAELQKAMRTGNSDGTLIALESLQSALNGQHNVEHIWNRILNLINQRAKLVESQWRKEFKAGLELNEEALLLISAVEAAIMAHVADRRERQKVIQTLENIAIGAAYREAAPLTDE